MSEETSDANERSRPGDFCGTTKGYHLHRRAGERACLECRHAHAADMRAYLNRNGKRRLFNARMRARTAAMAALRVQFSETFERLTDELRRENGDLPQGTINRIATRKLREMHRPEYVTLYRLALKDQTQNDREQQQTNDRSRTESQG